MRELNENKNERNRFTRMCIGDALIALMKQKDFKKISVSDISKKAGLSRVTYYNYYVKKEDIINDYLGELVAEYILEVNQHPEIGSMMSYRHILFSLKFFDRYADFFKTLESSGLHSLIINAMNDFMEEKIFKEYPGSIYELYCYGGALLNMFLKWEKNEKNITAENLAQIIEDFVTKEANV
ncbi:TetR/AcrR family transcriptional regulator [Anaerotignum sp.]|uniref:TetR/AcrR family transcriptional regulator n=1 Tax=Anaerotignum sp. TaxID=2039241 RepID=UPI00332B67C7